MKVELLEKVNEEKIKNYFLGNLAAAEAEGLEENLATDAELFEQAEIIEGELIDAYSRKELSARENLLFEQNYLTTDVRREKLKFAQTFHDGLQAEKSPQTVAEKPQSIWQSLSAFWNAPRLAFAVIAVLLLTLGGFWFLSRNWKTRPEVAQTDNQNITPPIFTPRDTTETSPKIVASPTPPVNLNAPNSNSKIDETNLAKSSSTNKKPSPSPTSKPEIKPTLPAPTPEKKAPTFAAFVLLPGTLRSEEGEQFIKIPPKTDKIKLRLKLPSEAAKFQTYQATLKTADGETLFTSPNLKSLNVIFPAKKLENGTYILFLEGQTTADKPAESITEYTFRVKRQ